MLLLGTIILVMTIPLASFYLSTILIHRCAFLILLNIVVYNIIDSTSLSLFSSSEILGGLYQISILSQAYNMPLYEAISSFQDLPNLLAVSVIVYSNAETNRSKILLENKGKAGIYQWTHNESGKRYIGSAVDLTSRLKNYYNKSLLNRHKSMHIYNALLHHEYSSFSLTILEYIDISNLSKDNARKAILEKEQHYIDSLTPEYNILPIAGSRLGSRHTEKTKTKISGSLIGKISGNNNPMFGKSHSSETKNLMSTIKGSAVFVYTEDGLLVNTFVSIREAGRYFECNHSTISRYLKSRKIFKKKWILSISKEIS